MRHKNSNDPFHGMGNEDGGGGEGPSSSRVLRQPSAKAVPSSANTSWRSERLSFIGRQEQLEELRGHLEDGARLMTIFGAPGLGKTRLLRRLGVSLLDEGTDVWFCDLTSTTALGDVLHATAQALSVSLAGSSTADEASAQLGENIAARGRVFILLDNFEQVVIHAEATLGLWLRMAPEARFGRYR